MKKYLLLIGFLSFAWLAHGQTHPAAISTRGGQSPIVEGAKAKINYLTRQQVAYNIPDDLIPYLAGLLMMNKVDSHNDINQALLLWIGKYNQLKQSIAKLPDGTAKSQASYTLAAGDFPAVEKLLNVKTDYTAFSRYFSNSIQTSGNQSPVIVGDYANVTYTVSQVIRYDLPEGVTLNLLLQLKQKSGQIKTKADSIKNLRLNLDYQESVVKEWVRRYREIAAQLQATPDTLHRRALQLLHDGKFQSALDVLNSAAGDDEATANNRLLKARIMLLKFDYKDVDEELKKINTYYLTSVPLVPTLENNLDYARFLIYYTANIPAATPYLLQALGQTSDPFQKVTILNMLSISYTLTDHNTSVGYEQQALDLLDQHEPLRADSLLEQKSELQFNLGTSYEFSGLDTGLRASIRLTEEAIKTLGRITRDTMERAKRTAQLEITLGKGYEVEGRHQESMEVLIDARKFYERQINQQPQLWVMATNLYNNLAQDYFDQGTPYPGLEMLQRARRLCEPNVNPRNKPFFNQLNLIYTPIILYYMQTNRDSAGYYLLRLDSIAGPLIKDDPNDFQVVRAGIYADLGTVYVQGLDFKKAVDYLEQSYTIFTTNLLAAQTNMPKFYACTVALNNAYIGEREYGKAIAFNQKMIRDITSASKVDPFKFQLIIPQANSQMSLAYTAMPKLDSALKFAKLAIVPVESLTKQYPLLYYFYLATYTSQLLSIYGYMCDNTRADSVFDHYTVTWNSIYAISDLANHTMRAVIAESTCSFADQYYYQNVRSTQDKTAFYDRMEKLLGYAESEYKEIPLNSLPPIDRLRMATFYCKRAMLENEINFQPAGDEASHKRHAASKCDYYRKATELADALDPSAGQTKVLRMQLQQLPVGDCAN